MVGAVRVTGASCPSEGRPGAMALKRLRDSHFQWSCSLSSIPDFRATVSSLPRLQLTLGSGGLWHHQASLGADISLLSALRRTISFDLEVAFAICSV